MSASSDRPKVEYGPWILVTGRAEIEEGVYQIEHDDHHYDSELEPGQIEIYEHPIRGLSYWDDMADDSTDFAGHVAVLLYLDGRRIRRVLTPKG